MKKEKAIAIPVSFVDDKPRFLTVRDVNFKEWIFVTGGCRKREFPIRCALRELEEETRGIVKLRRVPYSTFNFEVIDKNGDILVYNVFIFVFNIDRKAQSEIIDKFYSEKKITDERKRQKLGYKKTYDENDRLSFDTLEIFNRRRRWDLITKNIIENPEFYSALTSSNRRYLNN